MTDQLTFDLGGSGPRRPRKPERLFYAVFPAPETAADIGRFADAFLRSRGLRWKRHRTERLHLSLQFVGDFGRLPSDIVFAAKRAGEAVMARACEVALRAVASFESPPGRDARPLVLLGDGDGLSDLHQTLGAAMEANGLKAAPHFRPHVTLSYGPWAIPLQTVGPIRFVADEFVLVHSLKGLTRYEMLGRWRLRR